MTMNVTGVALLFAELDVPSFSAFPLSGLVVWVVFAAVMAAGIAAAIWMDGENKKLAIPQMEWWYLGIGAVLAALLVGTMELGPLMLPAVAVGFVHGLAIDPGLISVAEVPTRPDPRRWHGCAWAGELKIAHRAPE